MKRSKNEKKPINKQLLIGLFLLLLGILAGGLYLFITSSNSNTDEIIIETTEETIVEEEILITPQPEYNEIDSAEAILSTATEALAWSTDAKLYSCTGMTLSSIEFTDVTYTYLGEDEGKYKSWICDYYSTSNDQTITITNEEGVVEAYEPFDTGEYGYLMYNAITYPTNLAEIISSSEIYIILEDQYDFETMYRNMYLKETQDYGYVWKVEERSMFAKDDSGTGILKNTYIIDIYSGEILDVTQTSVY